MDPKIYNASAIYSRISLSKNNLISPKAYFEDVDRLLEDKQHKMPYLYKIYELYVRKLKRSGAMDFDDLLYQMHRLLEENPDNVLRNIKSGSNTFW